MNKKNLFVAVSSTDGEILNAVPLSLKELENKSVTELESNCEGSISIYKMVPVMELEFKGVTRKLF